MQVNFSEAMDPTSVTGETEEGGAGFRNLMVRGGVAPVAGSWTVSNEYRTVEFQTADLCGTNSCGGNVYCLSSNTEFTAIIVAATLGAEPPASSGFPYDGAVDASGNSLDGNNDNLAAGPPADSFLWDFSTDNTIDLRPPTLEILSPGIDEGNVAVDRPIEMTFSKIMSGSSLTNENISLGSEPLYEFWYSLRSELLDERNEVATSSAPVKTRALIEHGVLASSSETTRYDYFPGATSGVKDVLQNCFFPGAGPRSGSDAGGGVCATSRSEPYCCNGNPSATACPYLRAP